MNYQSPTNVDKTISRIMEINQLTRQDYFDLVSLFLSDFLVTKEERNQINLVFDQIYQGKIQFSD